MRTAPRRSSRTVEGTGGRALLADAASRLEEALSPSPERVQAILDERARRLARVPERTAPVYDGREALIFQIGRERYAIETPFVREVIRTSFVARMPRTAGFFHGVVNLRGEIVGVVDLHRLLDLPSARLSDLPWLIVLGKNHAEFAVAVEAAHALARLRSDASAQGAGTIGPGRNRLVRSVGADAVILLDGAALLNDQRTWAGRSAGGNLRKA